MNSILTSVKKVLGISSDYDAFDIDIIIHINTVFLILNQLGIGPENPFSIEDADAEWSDFLGNDLSFEAVKTYVALKVRMMFDPPSSATISEAINKTINELEWRLLAASEIRKEVAE